MYQESLDSGLLWQPMRLLTQPDSPWSPNMDEKPIAGIAQLLGVGIAVVAFFMLIPVPVELYRHWRDKTAGDIEKENRGRE